MQVTKQSLAPLLFWCFSNVVLINRQRVSVKTQKQPVQHLCLLHKCNDNRVYYHIGRLRWQPSAQVYPKGFVYGDVRRQKLNQSKNPRLHADFVLQPQTKGVKPATAHNKGSCRCNQQFYQSVFDGQFVHQCAYRAEQRRRYRNKPVVVAKRMYQVTYQITQKSHDKRRHRPEIYSRQKTNGDGKTKLHVWRQLRH